MAPEEAAQVQVSEVAFTLPEPPSMNAMLGYAKSWKGRKYYVKQQEYRDAASLAMDKADWENEGPWPWKRWAIKHVHFRLWNRRDPLELLAGLKWVADLLIDEGWVAEDTEDHLVYIAYPTQEIDRKNRGVDLVIERR